MTTQSDTPGEGLDLTVRMQAALAGLVRLIDIIHAENANKGHILPDGPTVTEARRLADLVLSPSVASDIAALPSGYEGLVDALKPFAEIAAWEEECQESDRSARLPTVFLCISTSGFSSANCIQPEHFRRAREAIAALGRVEPVAWQWRQCSHRGTWGAWNDCWDSYSLSSTAEKWRDHAAKMPNEVQVRPLYATPPAPQPALALIEELTGSIQEALDIHYADEVSRPQDEMVCVLAAALASAKRFKGE